MSAIGAGVQGTQRIQVFLRGRRDLLERVGDSERPTARSLRGCRVHARVNARELQLPRDGVRTQDAVVRDHHLGPCTRSTRALARVAALEKPAARAEGDLRHE